MEIRSILFGDEYHKRPTLAAALVRAADVRKEE